jgi:hypothetical protein
MTEKAHATLSPSSADRWGTCFASVQLESGLPDSSSDYADEGTAAHAVAEMALSEGNDAAAYVGRRIAVSKAKTVEVTADMAVDVQKYVDYVREVSEGQELMLERKLDISRWVPECFGTSDTVILRGDGELHICDLKFGRGVRVNAEGNKQLMLYALGALDEFSLVGDFDRVRMTIHQPRLNHVSEATMSVADLLAEGAELKEAADRAYLYVDSETPPNPSDFAPSEKACRFCKARGTCPAAAAEVAVIVSRNTQATADDFDVVVPDAAVPVIDLSYLMSKVDQVEAWCKGVRAELERRLFAGIVVDGWKLVAGKAGARKWSDAQAAEEAMKAMRLKTDEMYDKTVISPTSAEKLLKEQPRRWTKLQALITKSGGSPSVAPADDKRPALDIKPTAEDFDVVEEQVAEMAGEDLV